MKGFWKNEWDLFLEDMRVLGEFCLQPVTLFGNEENKMLKPSNEEIEEKAEMGGFWSNQWNLFKQDMNNMVDFLTQPVTFK